MNPTVTPLPKPIPMNLLRAMAKQEGFFKHGTRAQKNNNPGNINYGKFAQTHGATGGDDKGYAIFPTPGVGWAALEALLKTPTYKGRTLREALYTYCPPKGDRRGDNDTDAYIRNVCDWTGLTPNTIIDDFVKV
jgi:hypothetical protein